MSKTKLRPLYVKLTLTSFVFVLLLTVFFFSLQFYLKTIMKKLENIATLKKEIAQNQASKEKELKLQQLINFFQNQSGKEISAVLFDIQQALNPDFEKTKEFLLKKFNDEKWKIVNSNFNLEEKRLGFVLEIPSQDISHFFDFLQGQSLIIKIESLKIEKLDTNYRVDLSLDLR